MIRIPLFFFFITFLSGLSFSQATIQGIIVLPGTGKPLPGINVKTLYPDQAVTDDKGWFAVLHANGEPIKLIIELDGESIEWTSTQIASGETDLGSIRVEITDQNAKVELPTITLDEIDDQESANIPGLLRTGDDLFGGLTDYTFSPARFRRRGLESQYSEGYLNQLPINDLESGNIFYSSWSGLNDVMRLDANTVGAEFSEWGYGGIAGSSNTDLRASSQWKKKQVAYAVTNRNYRNRIMGTWSTGLLPSGWAFSFSGSRRWSHEGYIPGTFYDGWAYFASIDKRISDQHTLNFVTLGSPYKRGGNSTSTQEMYYLARDHFYNSFWGYQQGEKRNARIYSGYQPLFMLRHDWNMNEKFKLTTSVGFQTGKSGIEALDWLYGNDPRPDYYRRLPSYVEEQDYLLANEIFQSLYMNETLLQIQWDKLYEINRISEFTVEDADGIEGNHVTGALSHYVMEDRRSDVSKKSGNAVLQYQINDRNRILAGVNAIIQDTRNYKVLTDLLGGEFYLDWDKFAASDFPGNDAAQQNDLRRPNRIVHTGDQFGYDYYSRIRQQSAWISYQLDTRKWEIGLGGSLKNHVYWRDGQTQNGKFPDNSFGESGKNDFFLPSAKGVFRYKFDGRNYLTASGAVSQLAPSFRNAYVSPRTRDHVVNDLVSEKILAGEARYDFTSPYLKFSLAGYYITTNDGIESTNFYHDDERTFINFTLTNIDKKYSGVEGALQYTLIPGLIFEAAASIGQYVYTSRPKATITQDNDGSVLQEDITIYAKNFHLGESPQRAYTAGLTYKSKHYWTVYLNINRFEDQYISINPLRRTIAAVDVVEFESEQWKEIIEQEEIDPTWTVDVSLYKSFKADWLADGAILAFNFSMTNVLDEIFYINGGYEQYRFDFTTRDVSRFPSRYSYMQGLNYFTQVSLRF